MENYNPKILLALTKLVCSQNLNKSASTSRSKVKQSTDPLQLEKEQTI